MRANEEQAGSRKLPTLPCIPEDNEAHAGRRMHIYNEVLTTSTFALVNRTASEIFHIR